MDIFTPKMVVAGAVVAFLSASVNTGMFVKVNDKVIAQGTDITIHKQQINNLKEQQTEIKGYTKDIYEWVQQQKGKDSVRDRQD